MKYRKKPVVVDAFQFTGGLYQEYPKWMADDTTWKVGAKVADCNLRNLVIVTLEGEMIARPGDWIIRGVNGEIYPCKPGIFEKTYEPVQSI